ncbi:hypothetical protein C8R47DRAFT_1238749 [Mycena vitilis]|nr:hypothetical protein C8R47DRAFT_1238749 [Mycena vitilis]
MPRNATQPKSSAKKRKPRVNFGANGSSRKRKSSPTASSDEEPSSTKRARAAGTSGSTGGGASTSTGNAGEEGAHSTRMPASEGGMHSADEPANTTPPKKRVRNRWGIRPTEVVPVKAKLTQRAFQRIIRGLCGLLTQEDTLPPATEARKHYDKRFDGVDDYRAYMQTLVDESRTAVTAAKDLATRLIREAKRIPGLIANDIARIPEAHLATVFTMILKAGLQGFCPDLDGPVQSTYNQLHRHLAVSGFQFLSSSLAMCTLEVNLQVAEDTDLLCDMYDNYVYGTLAQKTKMERRRPGSLSQSLTHGAEFKARGRLSEVRFKTATSLGLRKPVMRMASVQEAHSDDEQSSGRVRMKPGRNPIIGRFFREELDPAAEEYRKRNAKRGQKVLRRAPKPRIRGNPLLPASDIGVILPPDVPVDFFTPAFFNALTLKERARYVNTGVAFPLEDFAFDEAHEGWKTMGKKEFMEKYGDDVLDQYDIPSPEEINALPDSDAEDDEEEEINLEDTEDEEDEEEMEVDDDLRNNE